jgi:autotransporter strand-loop-strand O-heptosyltransferase
MFKQVVFHGSINERTGYGVHASRFTEQLSKLIPVSMQEGDVHISLLDVVTASQTTTRWPAPSILYTVWESTEYPAAFLMNLKLYDQMWVPSEWQKACSIADGIPEEFVKVVHEGVDPEIYKPLTPFPNPKIFSFLHVGQWQPRKSTLEICQSFLKAFPTNKKVRLYLSTDTLFPSDEYKSTEERLKAHGLNDPRIIPIHYEEREAYVRRLQSAHCFVTCARSEGWNLPLIEAMACGIPSIASDFGGSTEYAGEALNVRIRELRKPEGIYGGWDVPGKWGEPDYDHLVDLMRDVYDNFYSHQEKALKTSEFIRTEFSWEKAALKAYEVLQDLSQKPEQIPATICQPSGEAEVRAFARSKGYEISSMKKRSVIFTVDSHPNTTEKMNTLIETLVQIRSFGYPVLLTSHFPIPAAVVELCDYHIYDKHDILSPPDDHPFYWKKNSEGVIEARRSSIPCHALAAITNFRNAIDYCLGKYDWIYNLGSDTEVDLGIWLEKVYASNKEMICQEWDHQKGTISGQIFAMKTAAADKVIQRYGSWAEFADDYGGDKFNSEQRFYKDVVKHVGLENIEWLDMDIGNRFDQVDRNVWDDEFQIHFLDGPYLNIAGESTREYDVSYSNPIDGVAYALKQHANEWSRPTTKYYRDWTVRAHLDGELKFEHHLDLRGKKVIVSMASKALGDTLAWIPYVEEFRKKHGCIVLCSTWWNGIMDYPEINFCHPGDVVDEAYASYSIGCFDDQLDFNVTDWRRTPLQKVASDILGLEYEPLRAKLKYEPAKKGKPYVCFSEFSTMQNKFWNREGAWQKIIDHLNGLGYDCVSISVEQTKLQGVVNHNGQSIEQTLVDIAGAEFYIGLNAGPTWIAYSLGIPTIMITGVSEEWNDFPNPYRVSIDTGCKPCFNDLSVKIDRGWDWCYNENKFVCTKEITEDMVKDVITKLREDLNPCQVKLKRKKASPVVSRRKVRKSVSLESRASA